MRFCRRASTALLSRCQYRDSPEEHDTLTYILVQINPHRNCSQCGAKWSKHLPKCTYTRPRLYTTYYNIISNNMVTHTEIPRTRSLAVGLQYIAYCTAWKTCTRGVWKAIKRIFIERVWLLGRRSVRWWRRPNAYSVFARHVHSTRLF